MLHWSPSQAGVLGRKRQALPAAPAEGVHLPGCLGDGWEGQRAVHTLRISGLSPGPLDPSSKKEEGNKSFRALILSTWAGTTWSQGPCCRHAGQQSTLSLCPRTPLPDPTTCGSRSLDLPCILFRATTLPTSYPWLAFCLAPPCILLPKGN